MTTEQTPVSYDLDDYSLSDLTWIDDGPGGDSIERTWAAEYLRDRGVDPDVAVERGYFTPEKPAEWTRPLGHANDGRWVTDSYYTERWSNPPIRPLGIPLLHRTGGIGTVQLRPERPVTLKSIMRGADGKPVMEKKSVRRALLDANNQPVIGDDGKQKMHYVSELVERTEEREAKFLAPAGVKRGLGANAIPTPDIHPFVAEWLDEEEADADLTRAFLVEGVVKADSVLSAAIRSDRRLLTLALTGVTMGYESEKNATNRAGRARLTEEMAAFPWTGRVVYLCFDGDWHTNKNVSSALNTTAQLLADAGADVHVVDIPESSHAKGIDDFIVMHGDQAFWDLLDSTIEATEVERLTKEYERTDLGRAERLADEMRHGKAPYKFVIDSKSTLRWTGTHWEDDYADSILVSLAGALTERDPEDSDAKSERALNAAARLAKSFDGTSVRSTDLDQHPYLWAARNCVVDLRTGETMPHDPELLLTKNCGVDYEPELPTPTWDRMLDVITQGDDAFRGWLQQMVGLSMLGVILHPLLIVPLGPANTWKSKFVQAITGIFGPYAKASASEKLADADGELIASLAGARLVTVSEAGERTEISDSQIKMLTSSDKTRGRALYRGSVDIVPTWSVWMPANHRLGLDSADDSIWKRVVYAPFAHKIQPSEEIQDLNSKIADELPGILAWAVAGAVAFMSGDRSFPTCQAVTDATARARNAGDPIENWITDNVQTEPETFTNRKEIYEDFVSYQQALGLRFQWKMSTLHEKLIARGIVLEFQSRTGKLLAEKVNNGERLWKGLRLKTALDHRAEEARAAAAEIPATVPEAWVDEMLDEGIQFT